jgi:glycosyltransferase involved in cell wall biosynthesis
VHGGPSKAIATMEAALSAQGVEVTTLTTDDDGPGLRFAAPPLAAPGVTRVYQRKRTEFYKVAPGLASWLWRNVARFDLVHIHALFSFSSVAAAAMCAQRGVPYVVRPLGTLSQYGLTRRRRLLKRISLAVLEGRVLQGASAVHFTSELEAEEASAALSFALNGVVIPLGLDGLAESQPERQSSTGRKAAGTTILFMSRLDPKKNVEGLLDAFARLAPAWPGLRLSIAGRGSTAYERSLHQRAGDLGLGDKVAWLGHVEGAAKTAALSGADIFVLPSISENFGIAVAEAMLAGLPCVVGRGVALACSIEWAEAGLAVDPDPQSIAAAIETLLSRPQECRGMGENARRFAQAELTAEAMAHRLIALYRDIVNQDRGHAP